MKLGIMQPYFLPYLGYWQMINAVDKYVIYDDVNYIVGGWVNRNRILLDGKPRYFNVPLLGASPNKKINEVRVNRAPALIGKSLRVIEATYAKAPYYASVRPLIERIVRYENENLAEYLTFSIREICAYLGITTELIVSSILDKDCSLRGQNKVLAICALLGADEYYNAIGGRRLYSLDEFSARGINLSFLQTLPITYPQFGGDFVENLSIIDVLMFNSPERVRELLDAYTLVK